MDENILKYLYVREKQVGSTTTALRISKPTYEKLKGIAHSTRIPIGKLNAILVEYAIADLGLSKE